MRKHLYFHSSDLDYIYELNNDSKFEKVPEYYLESEKVHPHEWGRLKTDNNYYHILIGKIPKKDCPWCGCSCEIKKIDQIRLQMVDRLIYCIECMNCKSRGPLYNFDSLIELDKDYYEAIKDMMWTEYQYRKPWDEGLINERK